jgi:hypothetical protein
MLPEILSLVSLELAAGQVCVELVVRVLFTHYWPLLHAIILMLPGILSLVSLEFLVVRMCVELIVRMFCGVEPPAIDPYIPRAKRPPLHLETFLRSLNDGINRFADALAPCISVERRCCTSKQRLSLSSSDAQRFFCSVWPLLDWLLSTTYWRYPWWSPRHSPHCPRWAHRRRHVLAQSVITIGLVRAQSALPDRKCSRAIFDSDSFDILVDGGATSCISNSLSDFVKPPTASTVRVKGFNGTTSSTRVGTVLWHILDDSGHRRSLRIRHTYYVPACPMRILSPQHYSQQTQDLRGTYSINFGDQVQFVWNRGQHRATMPLSTTTNVGILRSAPGHRVFSSFVHSETSSSPSHFCCPVITDDDADSSDDGSTASDDASTDDTLSPAPSFEGEQEEINTDSPRPSTSVPRSEAQSQRPAVIPFDLDHDDLATNLPSQDDTTSALDASTELLRWHYRLGHLPFPNLRLMAARGELPKRLAACRTPRCESCLYGQATKRPWRTKGSTQTLRTTTKPGQCVSVDQLESPVAGFVGQNKGFFFRKRYKVATVFVDHFSRLSFIYLQESTKGAETLLAKKAFEAYAASFGVKVLNYHADNGRFAEPLFLGHAETHGQTVSLCGVNAHFQNGIAEKRIRDLTSRARTSLLHAMNRWPSAVTIHLWPYALRFANDIYNAAPTLSNKHSPLEMFSKTPIRPQVLNYHPPFCPVYILHNGLQGGGGKRPNKWVRRSKIAIYMGTSPRHARSVALVLSLSTGYVSPQFHMKFDDFFETVQDATTRPVSRWQTLSRFASAQGETPRAPRASAPVDRAITGGAYQTAPRESPIFDLPHQGVPESDDDVPAIPLPVAPTTEGEPIPVVPPDPEQLRQPSSTRRSSRRSAPPSRLIETAYAVLEDTEAVEDYETQRSAEDPIAFASNKSDPDTMHYGEAMRADDAQEFKRAMLTEVNAHTSKGHWELWTKSEVPADQTVLPAVWAFKRKRRIDTREVYKYKARINAHGGKQTHGVNYWETYSPVVNWFSIRLCLILALIFKWNTRQIDFVLAFPQADVECDIFIELPRGVTFPGAHRSTHCLKLIKNLYGTKQASRVWNQHLVDGLVAKLPLSSGN